MAGGLGVRAGSRPRADCLRLDLRRLAEERRLLYVALSRAERELHCSWARQRRSSNGAVLWREPSPWLGALAACCASPGERRGEAPLSPTTHQRSHLTTPRPTSAGASSGSGFRGRGPLPDDATLDFLASARRRLTSRDPGTAGRGPTHADPSDAVLVERLTDWRRRLARGRGSPRTSCYTDSTVNAIALRKPANEQELLGVPGLGAVKVARFGPAILEALQAPPPLPARPRTARSGLKRLSRMAWPRLASALSPPVRGCRRRS